MNASVGIHVVIELEDDYFLDVRLYSQKLSFQKLNRCWAPGFDVENFHISPEGDSVLVCSFFKPGVKEYCLFGSGSLCAYAVLGTDDIDFTASKSSLYFFAHHFGDVEFASYDGHIKMGLSGVRAFRYWTCSP